MGPFDAFVIGQYAVTALSSGFNLLYFLRYRSSQRRRRIGAVALALVCLAWFGESLYFSLYALFREHSWPTGFFGEPQLWLALRLLFLLSSLFISLLILRWLALRRNITP